MKQLFALTMARRAVAVAAILTALPVFAQTSVRDHRGAAESLLRDWIEAFNSGASTARFFTSDATLVRGNGVFVGGAVIDGMEQRESSAGLRLALVTQRWEAVGTDGAWTIGEYKLTLPGKNGAPAEVIPGVAVHVLQQESGTWRMRVATFTRQFAPPPKAAQSSATSVASTGQ